MCMCSCGVNARQMQRCLTFTPLTLSASLSAPATPSPLTLSASLSAPATADALPGPRMAATNSPAAEAAPTPSSPPAPPPPSPAPPRAPMRAGSRPGATARRSPGARQRPPWPEGSRRSQVCRQASSGGESSPRAITAASIATTGATCRKRTRGAFTHFPHRKG